MEAHNPYVPPSSVTPAVDRPSRLWWIYLVFRALITCGAIVLYLESSRLLLFALSFIDALGLLGLLQYVRGKTLFGLRFWQAVLGIYLAKTIATQALSINKLIELQYFDWMGIGFQMVMTVPLAIALWLYVVGSPQLWRPASAN